MLIHEKNEFIICIAVILLLAGCQSSQQSQQPKLIKEETTDFDIKTAMEMVKTKEKMIVDLALRDKVSKMI